MESDTQPRTRRGRTRRRFSAGREGRLLATGLPIVLLHGAGGPVDELIGLGLLGGLVAVLVYLSFRGTRNKKKRPGHRRRRGRH